MKQAFDKHFDSFGIPDIILIMGFGYNEAGIRNFLKSDEFLDMVPSGFSAPGTDKIRFLLFDAEGKLHEATSEAKTIDVMKIEQELRRFTTTHIFRERGALLTAAGGFHFEKPSERHSLQFIRAGEALRSHQETFFLAAWLIRRIPAHARRIYCDSASISALGYVLAELHRRCNPKIQHSVEVESFGGYKGVKDFKFRDDPDTFYLISSSTSGSLAEKLQREFGIAKGKISLLCYIGSKPTEAVVFDLSKDAKLNEQGFETVENYEAGKCHLCDVGSKLLHILGDQFVPSAPRTIVNTITKASCPVWLSPFLRDFKAMNVPYINHYDSASRRYIDLFLDIATFLKKSTEVRFTDKLKQRVAQNLPGKIGGFIVLDDESSFLFFQKIKRFAKRADLANVPVIRKSKLMSDPDSMAAQLHKGCVVVVSSIAGSGKNLLAVSQILRSAKRGDSIYYITAICRTPSPAALSDLKTDLTFGQLGRESYRFDSIEEIYLPSYSLPSKSSWAREYGLWNEVLAGAKRNLAVEERRKQVQRPSDRHLFLASTHNGKPLEIRNNFALVDRDLSETKFTQSEVYLIATAILHQERIRRTKNPADQASDFVRYHWTPSIFERFNDGVIQAAFLRAAQPSELDYSASPELSAMMRDTLKNLLQNHAATVGEASSEFLLALADGRIRLTVEDFLSLKKTIDRIKFVKALPLALATYIKKMP